MKTLSIVVPAFREARNLPALHRRLAAALETRADWRWELVIVNDGSPDDTWEVIERLSTADPRVMGIDLSRNFGKEAALSAGAEAARGDVVVCMDADLQHPPEFIPRMLDAWAEGAEIVATKRRSIEKQPLMRRVGSHVYYWLMAKISGIEMVSQTTDFRLYDRKVIEAFRRFSERARMFRGIMDWMGFRKVYLEFDAPAREAGQAGYSYRKLISLAVGSMTSFSLLPLKLAGYMGLFIAAITGLMLVWMGLDHFIFQKMGFTPLAMFVVANTFFIGVVMIGIGLVALYIGSIHTEVLNRPLFIVRERKNGGPALAENARTATSPVGSPVRNDVNA